MLSKAFYLINRTKLQLEKSLTVKPPPLLDASRRTVISWSAKSACTHVLIWHLRRLGLLSEAVNYHRWIHRYRVNVYYQSDDYLAAKRQFLREGPGKWTYLKIMRDPVKRAISSYRHALRYGYEDSKLTCVLGYPVNHKSGYSYQTFLKYLSAIDLHTCNIHHRVQAHPLDKLPFQSVTLINADRVDLVLFQGDIVVFSWLVSVHDEARLAGNGHSPFQEVQRCPWALTSQPEGR